MSGGKEGESETQGGREMSGYVCVGVRVCVCEGRMCGGKEDMGRQRAQGQEMEMARE